MVSLGFHCKGDLVDDHKGLRHTTSGEWISRSIVPIVIDVAPLKPLQDVSRTAFFHVDLLNHNSFNPDTDAEGVIMWQMKHDQIFLLKFDDRSVLNGWVTSCDLGDKSRLLDLSLPLPRGQLRLLGVDWDRVDSYDLLGRFLGSCITILDLLDGLLCNEFCAIAVSNQLFKMPFPGEAAVRVITSSWNVQYLLGSFLAGSPF
ncbi:unnamed protein product [Prunus armeniaca]